jgi:hypothetical protein
MSSLVVYRCDFNIKDFGSLSLEKYLLFIKLRFKE